MKFLISFVVLLSLSTAEEIYKRNVVLPAVENEGRITNGNNAKEGQFPYQVGLRLWKNEDMPYWCGGSLIGQNWILTAAHCTDGIESATVFLGSTVRGLAELNFTVYSNQFIIHPLYNNQTIKNDISLISIPTVTYTDKIQPIRLPAISNSYSTYAGEYVIMSGWGRTSDSSISVASYLQWARFQVITNAICSRRYKPNTVTATNICIATPGGVSTCRGDSGGPMVLALSKIQIGLASFGSSKGCELGYPTASTRLTHYLQWIRTNTGISY